MSDHVIPVIARRPIALSEPEYREMMKYESRQADEEATRSVSGPHQEPWLNVLEERLRRTLRMGLRMLKLEDLVRPPVYVVVARVGRGAQ